MEQDQQRQHGSWQPREQRGGYRRSGDYQQRSPYPPRPAPPPESEEDRMRRSFARLGDESFAASPIARQIEMVSTDFFQHHDSKSADMALPALFECVTSLPTKTSVYAALVAVLSNNSDFAFFAANVVQRLGNELQRTIRSCNLLETKLLLRFASELCSCKVIRPESFFAVLEAMASCKQFSDASTATTALPSEDKVATEFIAYSLLICLMWAGPQLHLEDSARLQQLLAKIRAFLDAREQREAGKRPLVDCLGTVREDSLTVLFFNIRRASDDGWPASSCTPRFQEKLEGKISPTAQNDLLPDGIALGLLKDEDNAGSIPTSLPNLGLFESVADKLSPFDTFIMEDMIQDLLLAFHDSPKFIPVSITQLPCPKEQAVRIAVSVCFAMLLALPTSKLPVPFFPILFLEMGKCELTRDTVPPAMVQAAKELFSKLEEMDVGCAERYSRFLAMHLCSCTEFAWAWSKWMAEIKSSDKSVEMRSKFLRDTLQQCVSLSFWDRIKGIADKFVPDGSLEAYMPPKPEPCWPWGDEAIGEEAELARELLERLGKMGSAELMEWLGTDKRIGDLGYDKSLEIISKAILLRGSKSLAHFNGTLLKHGAALKQFSSGEGAGVKLVDHVVSFWANSVCKISTVIAKLRSEGLVSPTDVGKWIASQTSNPAVVISCWPWDLLRYTVDSPKVTAEVRKETLVSVIESLLSSVSSAEPSLRRFAIGHAQDLLRIYSTTLAPLPEHIRVAIDSLDISL